MQFIKRHILSGMKVIKVKANNSSPPSWYHGNYNECVTASQAYFLNKVVTYPIFLWCKGNTRWLHIIMVFYFRLLGGQEQFILLFYDWISIISMTKDSNKRYQTRTIFEPFFFFVKKCIHCVVSSVKKIRYQYRCIRSNELLHKKTHGMVIN